MKLLLLDIHANFITGAKKYRMTKGLLLYGANGYTGRLITSMAAEHGIRPVLAGRNAQAIREMADTYHLDYVIVDLEDKEALVKVLGGFTMVLHAAGPFRKTAKQMIEACLQAQTHYIDITGEIEVFELAKGYDAMAKQKHVMIMPGAGFDVVPTDCTALYLKKQLPDATQLKLAFANLRGAV